MSYLVLQYFFVFSLLCYTNPYKQSLHFLKEVAMKKMSKSVLIFDHFNAHFVYFQWMLCNQDQKSFATY